MVRAVAWFLHSCDDLHSVAHGGQSLSLRRAMVFSTCVWMSEFKSYAVKFSLVAPPGLSFHRGQLWDPSVCTAITLCRLCGSAGSLLFCQNSAGAFHPTKRARGLRRRFLEPCACGVAYRGLMVLLDDGSVHLELMSEVVPTLSRPCVQQLSVLMRYPLVMTSAC